MNRFNNQNGSVAITMVLTSILLITPIIVNFTFDTNIHKLKVYNIEDRSKAKLTAESGLQFAMARLRLYKEAYNFLQKNKQAQSIVKQDTIDTLWNFPFAYPIPVKESMTKIQQDAINDFMDKTVLHGNLTLSIENISQKMNLNLLRISFLNETRKAKKENETGTETESEEDNKFNIESQLIKSLQNAVEAKSENDDNFANNYYGIEYQDLINELKYYVSEPESLQDTGGADSNFSQIDLSPKKAPFTSFEEVYSLPSWPDDIVNLIKNEFTVHGALMIDLNQITDKLFKLLIPEVTDEDVKAFFEWKNDPDVPQKFNSLDDFKNYIVQVGNLMSNDDFDERFNNFKKQGLQFGPTPTLFKVISTGTVERATYNLVAYVTIPAEPQPRIIQTNTTTNQNTTQPPENSNPTEEPTTTTPTNNSSTNSNSSDDSDKKTTLLEPRIVEIVIN